MRASLKNLCGGKGAMWWTQPKEADFGVHMLSTQYISSWNSVLTL
jgi:hypothetical protein